jgi:hypothetical protein
LVLWMLCDRGDCIGLAMEWQMGMEFVEHCELFQPRPKHRWVGMLQHFHHLGMCAFNYLILVSSQSCTQDFVTLADKMMHLYRQSVRKSLTRNRGRLWQLHFESWRHLTWFALKTFLLAFSSSILCIFQLAHNVHRSSWTAICYMSVSPVDTVGCSDMKDKLPEIS